MKCAIFDDVRRVSAADLQRDLLQLPQWRVRQALAYRHLVDQMQCVKAYLLLRQCLAEAYGIHSMPGFSYGEHGKPRLVIDGAEAQVDFNISHCVEGVMCVVDDAPVGCDIEVIPNEWNSQDPLLDEAMMAACFSAAEQRQIQAACRPQVEFARLWTAKEAVLKLVGTGLTDDLPALLTSAMAENVDITTRVCEQKGYAYSIARTKRR